MKIGEQRCNTILCFTRLTTFEGGLQQRHVPGAKGPYPVYCPECRATRSLSADLWCKRQRFRPTLRSGGRARGEQSRRWGSSNPHSRPCASAFGTQFRCLHSRFPPEIRCRANAERYLARPCWRLRRVSIHREQSRSVVPPLPHGLALARRAGRDICGGTAGSAGFSDSPCRR